MVAAITWRQALAWRMHRQLLEPTAPELELDDRFVGLDLVADDVPQILAVDAEDLVAGLQHRAATRAVQVPTAPPDREQVEPGVLTQSVPAGLRAFEGGSRRDREAHDDVVGLAERDREHGMHLFVLLDQPHELLRGVADLLGCAADV